MIARLRRWGQTHPGPAVLAEAALLFAPALPAYLWLWPNVNGPLQDAAQAAAYLYLLLGVIFIGRRWSWDQLGVNGRGLALSLICGGLLILGRTLVILAVDWPLWTQPVTALGLLGDAAFYFGAVGLTEELLFRGLIYRALDEWRGVRWAIWGSTLAFGLYHLPAQGPLGVLGTGVIGLVFAVIRWRAGGLVGLIFVHGLADLLGKLMLPSLSLEAPGQPQITSRALLLLGYGLIAGVPLYLWKLYPRVASRANLAR